ncbi:MAG: efflux RND transporter periplasmic adaptor subunit [Halieaceae bacterium]|jgi:membrane fusion protein (multidrug efflux system)|nr:efflux RND transporter periplasmic adaptor subunit [Halieaceae bacterium]
MKKLFAVVVAVGVIGGLAWPKLAPLLDDSSEAPARAGRKPAVETLRLETQPFETTLTFNGTLLADKSIDIKSELRGKIERIAFTDGQQVKAGDLIVTIESGELGAELASIREQLTLAETNAERLQALFERGSVTASERDDAVSQREVLRAEERRLAVRLAKTRIEAPFDGTLGLRAVSPGDLIEADTMITTLQTLTNLQVDFSVPERFRNEVEPGTALSLTVAGHVQPFSAAVRAISPRVDVNTRTLTVRADVSNPDRRLLPGNYARVELVTRNDAALVVPSVAVLQSLESVSVYTVEDGVAKRREVRTGSRTDAVVEILGGLAPGDEIITSGIQAVRDGQAVDVRNLPGIG